MSDTPVTKEPAKVDEPVAEEKEDVAEIEEEVAAE